MAYIKEGPGGFAGADGADLAADTAALTPPDASDFRGRPEEIIGATIDDVDGVEIDETDQFDNNADAADVDDESAADADEIELFEATGRMIERALSVPVPPRILLSFAAGELALAEADDIEEPSAAPKPLIEGLREIFAACAAPSAPTTAPTATDSAPSTTPAAELYAYDIHQTLLDAGFPQRAADLAAAELLLALADALAGLDGELEPLALAFADETGLGAAGERALSLPPELANPATLAGFQLALEDFREDFAARAEAAAASAQQKFASTPLAAPDAAAECARTIAALSALAQLDGWAAAAQMAAEELAPSFSLTEALEAADAELLGLAADAAAAELARELGAVDVELAALKDAALQGFGEEICSLDEADLSGLAAAQQAPAAAQELLK